MRAKSLRSVLLLAAMVIVPTADADSLFDFSTLPSSGIVSAPPGGTTGWGYQIRNPNTTYWLMITGISADSFLSGTGDSSIFDFPILAPGTSISQAYDGVHGLFSFAWDAGTAPGTTNSGTFILNGEFWDGDPLNNGVFFESAVDQSAFYSVVAADAVSVPEPPFSADLVALLVACALVIWAERIWSRRLTN